MKKKGFTLVELLVVIALIAGISVVAITSLIGIADKRKEEEWENVKMTIESSAKSYYNANQYMFENLDNVEAYVTVGKLVKEGYLNVVKNPKTGKEISYCSRVKIIINGTTKKYEYEDSNDNNNCDYSAMLDSIEIRTLNGPQATVKFYKENNEPAVRNEDGWFNKASLDITNKDDTNRKVKLCIVPKVPDGKDLNRYVSYVKIDNVKIEASNKMYCTSYTDRNIGNVSLYLEDTDGGYWQKQVTFGVDTISPNITYNGILNKNGTKLNSVSTYNGFPVYDYDNQVYASVTAKDDTSGVFSVSMNGNTNVINPSKKEVITKFGRFDVDEYYAATINAVDVAGNESDDLTTNFIVASKPECPKFDVEGDTGDDSVTFVGPISIEANFNSDGDVYEYNHYLNNTKQNTTVMKLTDSNSSTVFSADGVHKLTGNVINKYNLKRDCDTPSYTKDTIPPNCGSFTYEYYTGEYSASPRAAGSCKQDTSKVDDTTLNRKTYRCYNEEKWGKTGTKIAVTYNKTSDTNRIQWQVWMNSNDSSYENPGSNRDPGNAKQFFRVYDNEKNYYYDAFSKKVNDKKYNIYGKYKKRGYVAIFDAAGNERYCYTDKFIIAKKIGEETTTTTTTTTTKTSTTKTTTTKKAVSCYNDLVYKGTDNDKNTWYRSNVEVYHGKTKLCTIKGEGRELTCEYTIAATSTTKSKKCKSGKVKIDKTAPTITYSETYGTSCDSFQNLTSNQVDHRAKLYIADGSENKSSGIDWVAYNYKYSKHSSKSCSTTWCQSTGDSHTENALHFARSNAALLKRTSDDHYLKIRIDFNFLESDSSKLYMKACDRAGNCTATEEFSIPNKSGSKKGYCRQIYGIKKPASNVCGDKDVNCYLVEDKK